MHPGRRRAGPVQHLIPMRKLTLVCLVGFTAACTQSNNSQPHTGALHLAGWIGAAAYSIDVPNDWNGTLFLYSHGYVAPGELNQAQAAPPGEETAWGASLGGIITAGLVQLNPGRFVAAMPLCGVLAGGIATWNSELDSAYAFKTLLAPGSALQLVHVKDGAAY